MSKSKVKEVKRLESLKTYDIIDSPDEQSYDELTRLAATLCQMPVSFISFIDEDKQWFKSFYGLNIKQTPKEDSFCKFTISQNRDFLEVTDTFNDNRFINNPFVQQKESPIRYYFGMKLYDKKQNVLGTLCVVDFKPNSLSASRKQSMRYLANQVMNLLELRKSLQSLQHIKKSLEQKNKELKQFANQVSHDIKMPLANIVLTIDLLKAKYQENIDDTGKQYLDYLKSSGLKLSAYTERVLSYYAREEDAQNEMEIVDFNYLLEDIIDLLQINQPCEINIPEKNTEILTNKVLLEQVLLNLLGNSLKYNDKSKIVIDINIKEDDFNYLITVTDNGMGIAKNKQKDVFKLFFTEEKPDRNGNKGTGIGLPTVQKLVKQLGGDVCLESEENKYTSVSFTLKKVIDNGI